MIIDDILLLICYSALVGVLSNNMTPIAEQIEEAYDWPSSVKGAIIDGISSSFPEFATAIVAVMFFNRVEVGINTIVGSALFNLLLIPGLCALFIGGKYVSLDAIGFRRDSTFYFVMTVLMAAAIYFFEGITLWACLFFLSFYGVYLWFITRHVVLYRAQQNGNAKDLDAQEGPKSTQREPQENEKKEPINKWLLWGKILGYTILIGAVCHTLVERAIMFGDEAGLSSVVIGFVILAAATSIPDLMLSVVSARRGKIDASISNVFSSNIFDICICIFLPILIFLVLNTQPKINVDLSSFKSVLVLIVCSFLTLFIFGIRKPKLSLSRGIMLVAVYVVGLGFILRI